MKKLRGFSNLLLLLSFIGFCSCTLQTYRISEKSVFKPTPYNASIDSLEYEDEKEESRLTYIMQCELLNAPSNRLISTNDTITVSRDYLSIKDSLTVEYICYEPKLWERTIFFFIGNDSRQTSYLKFLNQLAIDTNSRIYSWNYRGYGNSSGVPSFKTQFSDNNLVFDALIKQDICEEPIICIGYSLGSIFATKLVETKKIETLVLLSPVSNINDMLIHYKNQYLNGFKLVLRPFIELKAKEDFVYSISNNDVLEGFYGNLLILHSKDDKELPYSMGKKLYKEALYANKRFISLKAGGHGAAFNDKNLSEIVNWINDLAD